MKKLIEFDHVSYRYDQRKTDGITDVSFSIKKAQCVCLIGPSGSGKSTTAQLVAQILSPQKGQIYFFDNVKTAYVPQHSKLPNELTVFDYLLSCLVEISDHEKKETLIRTYLLLLNISSELHSPISNLSGGQRQRVIIAAALILNPNLIILDEPFGHLDEKLRSELMDELFSIFKEQKIACLWVTHETKEALSFSDKIIVLNYGVIQHKATPKEIYYRPANLFCAEFFGKNNSIVSKLISVSGHDLILNIKVLSKEIVITKPENFNATAGSDVLVIIRPEHIFISQDGDFTGKVTKNLFQGAQSLVEIELSSGYHIWLKTTEDGLSLGQKIQFTIDYSKVYCLDEI